MCEKKLIIELVMSVIGVDQTNDSVYLPGLLLNGHEYVSACVHSRPYFIIIKHK